VNCECALIIYTGNSSYVMAVETCRARPHQFSVQNVHKVFQHMNLCAIEVVCTIQCTLVYCLEIVCAELVVIQIEQDTDHIML
jgi:hypothetical protein